MKILAFIAGVKYFTNGFYIWIYDDSGMYQLFIMEGVVWGLGIWGEGVGLKTSVF